MPRTLPARFRTARSTLLVDRFMTSFIKVGGIGIIIAVFAILIFICWQVWPLFRPASVAPLAAFDTGLQRPLATGLDEWGLRPWVLGDDGSLRFFDAENGRTVSSHSATTSRLTCAVFDPHRNRLAMGTADGAVLAGTVRVQARFDASGTRSLDCTWQPQAARPAPLPGSPVEALAWSEHEGHRLVLAIQPSATGARVAALWDGAFHDLTGFLSGRPTAVLATDHADQAVLASDQGEVVVIAFGPEGPSRLQVLTPFAGRDERRISALTWIFGEQSLSLVAADGTHRIASLVLKPGDGGRRFHLTKDMPGLEAEPQASTPSLRNKAVLLAGGGRLSLRYATTGTELWQGPSAGPIAALALNHRYDRIAALGRDGSLRLYGLDDPHPEAGLTALFGRIWYEGGPQPAWTWQSSSGNDDFEPKLSMVPLIYGTLKATLWALIFAVPIALLGAIYTAEFMHPRFKTVVKPAVEIMASLPSVVLGFLGALWLAPLLEYRVPSVLCMLLAIPATAMLVGWVWGHLPPATRSRVLPGYEFAALVPLLLAVAWLAWELGPLAERLLFRVPVLDASGMVVGEVADFRRWWPQAMGWRYEQRNSLVVGFMMGFAVIPIIFTIAEDALSNVPKALRSGSLALGASRWQTAIRVVVPTASAGIFSALMIGLGRAIGETMIVVMATGNTAIMELNPFNGMRTISANIAVELPEAVQNGTLYRTLFFGGLLLFLFTFAINTVAELLRSHLRERYKTV